MAPCSFERPHHQAIASILRELDAGLLAAHHCLFGSGTAIALRYGEYRESIDIDFLVSDVPNYGRLRQLITGPDGLHAILLPGSTLRTLREIRADQYGIRTIIASGTANIKFEIVLEARIRLTAPDPEASICGVATIAPVDMVATKLLANSDRWADDSVHSRDLIDLAMMSPGTALEVAIEKSEGAYGSSIRRDFDLAAKRLLHRQGRLEACMAALKMVAPKALLWQRIQTLATRMARTGA